MGIVKWKARKSRKNTIVIIGKRKFKTRGGLQARNVYYFSKKTGKSLGQSLKEGTTTKLHHELKKQGYKVIK